MKRTGHPDMGCFNRKYKLNAKPTHHSPKQCRDRMNLPRERSSKPGAYCQFVDAMVQETNMWLGAIPSNETTSGRAMHERAVRFAKQNAEACFAFANELANARDIQDGTRHADSPALEVSGTRVMNGMAPAPDIIRCQAQRADRASHPIVGGATAKERAVPTVMLNHEEAYEEAGGR
jgi:hypothetical protein